MKRYALLFVFLCLTLLSCDRESSSSSVKEYSEKVTPTEKVTQTAPAPQAMTIGEILKSSDIPHPVIVTGQIVATENVDNYTYIHLKDATGEIWAAVFKMAVEPGKQIEVRNGMIMTQFYSKTLNKTFDKILLGEAASPGMESQTTGALPQGHPVLPANHPPTSPSSNTSSSDQKPGNIEKASGPGSYTIAEIYSNAQKLQGTTVKVRGKVIKFLAGILNANWLHLQDGSGVPAQKNHDLTITTQEATKVGEIIVVEGTLAVNKDFGAGYKYDVIVENAKIVSEK